MNRKFALLVILAALIYLPKESSACDVCGCSVSGQHLGILPQFQKHFVGLRYSFKPFQSTHPSLFSNDDPVYSREKFHIAELYSRYVVSERLHIFAFLPYQTTLKSENYLNINHGGIGDISVMAMYALVNQKKINDKFTHHLQAGVGIKLPTGGHHFLTPEGEWVPGIQNGTGTTDFLPGINYIIRTNSWGGLLESSSRINTRNAHYDFKYGPRWLNSIKLFYVYTHSKSTFMPSVGLNLESSGKDYHEGAKVDLSGGHLIAAKLGIDYFDSRFTAGCSVLPVMHQNVASGNLISGTRFSAHFAILF